MRRIHWIMLGISVVACMLFMTTVMPQYTSQTEIQRVANDSYVQVIATALSGENSHFTKQNLSIKDVLYISDTSAVATLHCAAEDTDIYAIFELQNDTLYLTNYSHTPFSADDFAQATDLSKRAITATGGDVE